MFDFDPQKDYYKILWVSENATDEEIKKAFRKAAMKHHPDKWWDVEKFKQMNEANMVIGDKQKRAQYDSVRKGWFGGWWFGGGGWFGGFGNGWFQVDFGGGGWFWDLSDIIEQFMWWMGGGWFSKRPRKGDDVKLQMDITFEQSYHGLEKTFDYTVQNQDGQYLKPEQKTIKVTIPKGIESGQYIRYTGMGNGGIYWWPEWDLYVKINVLKHKKRQRNNDDIIAFVETDIFTLVIGWILLVDHPDGKVEVKVPKGTQPQDILRVKWKGFGKWWFFDKKGDLLVRLQIGVPNTLSSTQEKLRKELQKSYKK